MQIDKIREKVQINLSAAFIIKSILAIFLILAIISIYSEAIIFAFKAANVI